MHAEIIYEGFPILNPAMKKIFQKVAGFAKQGYPLILFGPSGSGKEFLARYYNEEYSKAIQLKTEIIAINCSNLSEELAISELFGHVKGAFTGATQNRTGLFQLIEYGVIFLDEIGDLHPRVQAMLLRALNPSNSGREGKQLGSDKAYSISKGLVVICATEQPPEGIRESLLPRLGAQIYVPGMEQRTEDNSSALHWFLLNSFDIRRDKKSVIERLSMKLKEGVNVTENIIKEHFAELTHRRLLPLLQSKSWPGNYRALRNAVNEAVVLAESFSSIDSFSDEVVANFRENLKIHSKSIVPEIRGLTSEQERILQYSGKTEYWNFRLSEIFGNIDEEEKNKMAGFFAAYGELHFKRSDFDSYIGLYSNPRISQKRLQRLKEEKIIDADGKGKSTTYSIIPQERKKFGFPQPEILLLPPGECKDERFTDDMVKVKELLAKVKGIHISLKRAGTKEAFIPCLGAGLKKEHPLYYFSFEAHDAGFLIGSATAMLKKHMEVIPVDEMLNHQTSVETKVAFLSGYLERIIQPDLHPVMILDGINKMNSPEQQQILLSILRHWYFFKFILLGEKLENYLADEGILEFPI